MTQNEDHLLNNQSEDLINNENPGNAESHGWENNQPGTTADNDNNQHVPTITPYNDGSSPDPEEDFDDNDDDNDELIPIETDDDDEDLLADDEDDFIDDDDDAEDTNAHIDIASIVPNEDKSGRTSGRMIDHEPGTPNNL
ncbi:MAG TPA: hypothetical protein VNI52_06950 [Sphingobacteriaceae bacterium]|nr:hypothetical protein [Sphingobacteriaceae bacterium]